MRRRLGGVRRASVRAMKRWKNADRPMGGTASEPPFVARGGCALPPSRTAIFSMKNFHCLLWKNLLISCGGCGKCCGFGNVCEVLHSCNSRKGGERVEMRSEPVVDLDLLGEEDLHPCQRFGLNKVEKIKGDKLHFSCPFGFWQVEYREIDERLQPYAGGLQEGLLCQFIDLQCVSNCLFLE